MRAAFFAPTAAETAGFAGMAKLYNSAPHNLEADDTKYIAAETPHATFAMYNIVLAMVQ